MSRIALDCWVKSRNLHQKRSSSQSAKKYTGAEVVTLVITVYHLCCSELIDRMFAFDALFLKPGISENLLYNKAEFHDEKVYYDHSFPCQFGSIPFCRC